MKTILTFTFCICISLISLAQTGTENKNSTQHADPLTIQKPDFVKSGHGEPLYVVHLKNQVLESIDELTGERVALNEIDAKHIESIEVLKGQAAIDKYGKRGHDGVIVIKLKNEYANYISPEFLKKFKLMN